jgi:hypothetical protein
MSYFEFIPPFSERYNNLSHDMHYKYESITSFWGILKSKLDKIKIKDEKYPQWVQ